MARQALPIIGGVVGFMIGGPAGAQWGFAIGGMVGNAVDPQVIQGPRLGEGQENSASEGGYRPVVLGKGAVGVCMIHQGPLKKRTFRHRQSKGGGPVVEEERAYRTMAFGLGESAYPETGVALLRLWIDNKLRYDVTPTSQIVAESAKFAEQFTFYPGNSTQLPDPDLEAFLGAGNVPSYRGGAPYIVFPNWDVTDSRGMAPLIKAELAIIGETGPRFVSIGYGESNLDASMSNSKDGDAWSSVTHEVEPNAIHIISLGGTRVLVVAGGSSFWTDDFGLTKTPVTLDGYGGPHSGDYKNGVLLVPGSLDGIWRSTNRGVSISLIGGAPRSSHIAITETYAVSVYEPNESDVSFDRIGSWSIWEEGGNTGLYVGDLVGGIASSGPKVAVCGHSNAAWPTLRPAASFTSNGKSWDLRTIPLAKNGHAISVCGDGSGNVWLVATDQAEVWRTGDSGESWQKADVSAQITDIAHDGQVFVLVGTLNSEAFIGTSEDGLTVIRAASQPFVSSVPLVEHVEPTVSLGYCDLSEVVRWCHDRVNMPIGRYNTTELSDAVEGVVFADGYTAADAIRTAAGWYFFDAGEFDAGSGYRINYIKRGKAATVTLTERDIVEGPEDWEREDSYERPRVLHIAYQNPVADYGAPTIPIKRTSPDVLVVGEKSLNVPFVHSDQNEVARRGDMALTVVYAEIAGNYEIVLPVSWLSLAPTDIIGFSIRERVRRLRLTDWRFSPDGTIKTEWRADRQSAYTSNVTALPVVPPDPPPPSIVGDTVSAVLDIPSLQDNLDILHLVVAASGQTPAWWGAVHERKLPAETEFTPALSITAPTTIMGVLLEPVTSASPYYTDQTNIVRVRLYSDDDLATFTQQQFLSEHGAFALSYEEGGDTRWEVCQYRDAVKVGEREWELSTLARGRLDTSAAGHPVASMFVLLDSGIRIMPAQSGWIGQTITHRAVSNGQLPEDADAYDEEFVGRSQIEWPVAHVLLDRSGDSLEIEIVPRHRFGTDDHPIRSVNWDGYRIEATDGANAATFTTTNDVAALNVAGWGSSITVTVAQLNRITGAGPTVSETTEA